MAFLSTPILEGSVRHYNKAGRYLGYTAPNGLGGVWYFLPNHKKVATGWRNLFGQMKILDNAGRRIGTERPTGLDSVVIVDAKGHRQGTEWEHMGLTDISEFHPENGGKRIPFE